MCAPAQTHSDGSVASVHPVAVASFIIENMEEIVAVPGRAGSPHRGAPGVILDGLARRVVRGATILFQVR